MTDDPRPTLRIEYGDYASACAAWREAVRTASAQWLTAIGLDATEVRLGMIVDAAANHGLDSIGYRIAFPKSAFSHFEPERD